MTNDRTIMVCVALTIIAAFCFLVVSLTQAPAQTKCDPTGAVEFLDKQLVDAGGSKYSMSKTGIKDGIIHHVAYRRGANVGIMALFKSGCLISWKFLTLDEVSQIFGLGALVPTPPKET